MKNTLIIAVCCMGGGLSPAATCIGDWDFEDNLSATVGTSGTAVGTIGYGASVQKGSKLGNYIVDKDLGKALTLNGASQVNLNTPSYNSAVSPGASFTMMAYINFDAFTNPNGMGLFSTGKNAATGFALDILPKSGGYELCFLSKNVTANSTAKIDALTSGAWLHLALSYDAASHKALWYINGESVVETTIDSRFNPCSDGAVIGSNWTITDGNKTFFKGSMDDMQVHTGAMTQEEILKAAGMKAVPESSTATLALAGLAALLMRRRRVQCS